MSEVVVRKFRRGKGGSCSFETVVHILVFSLPFPLACCKRKKSALYTRLRGVVMISWPFQQLLLMFDPAIFDPASFSFLISHDLFTILYTSQHRQRRTGVHLHGHSVEKAGERIWMFPLPFMISMLVLLRCPKRDGLAANTVYRVHLFRCNMLILVI